MFSDWSVRDFELYWHIFLEGKENVVSTHSEPSDKIFGMGGRKRNRVSNFWNWGRGKACFSLGSKIDLFCEIDIIFITYTFLYVHVVCLSICIFQTLNQYGCGLVALSNVSCNLYFPWWGISEYNHQCGQQVIIMIIIIIIIIIIFFWQKNILY